MEEKHLQVFIDALQHYFLQVSGELPVVEPAYIKGEETIASNHTGIIGISGKNKGAIYFTAGTALLENLLVCMGEEVQPEYLRDMVGEVANTLSGNVRAVFGGEFMISVPVVLSGRLDSIEFPKHLTAFVIPLTWRQTRAYLIVCLE